MNGQMRRGLPWLIMILAMAAVTVSAGELGGFDVEIGAGGSWDEPSGWWDVPQDNGQGGQIPWEESGGDSQGQWGYEQDAGAGDYGQNGGSQGNWDNGQGGGSQGSWDYGQSGGGQGSWDYGQSGGGQESWDNDQGGGSQGSWDYGQNGGSQESWDNIQGDEVPQNSGQQRDILQQPAQPETQFNNPETETQRQTREISPTQEPAKATRQSAKNSSPTPTQLPLKKRKTTATPTPLSIETPQLTDTPAADMEKHALESFHYYNGADISDKEEKKKKDFAVVLSHDEIVHQGDLPQIKVQSQGTVQILSLRLNDIECAWYWEKDMLVVAEEVTKEENRIDLLAVSQGGRIIRMKPWLF